MITDRQLRDGLLAMLQSIEAPAISIEQIDRRIHAPVHHDRRAFAVGAAAAAALAAVVAIPIASPGVVQTLEQKVEQMLHWSPPAIAPPASVTSAMEPQTVSLQQAQARVKFTLVAPAGLPSDASSPAIKVAAVGVYAESTRTWSVGHSVVSFNYTRPGGRQFMLTAGPAASQTTPPSRYVYDADVKRFDAAGNPIPVKFEVFVWRNGDQITTAIAEGISAAEVAAIRTAMHGTPIPTVWPPVHGPNVVKMRLAPPH